MYLPSRVWCYCSLILLVKDFPCLQSSDKAAGAQVYFVSINNVDEEPDFVINLVAPGVPSPTVPPVSMASIQVPELCFQPYGLHQFSRYYNGTIHGTQNIIIDKISL